MKIKEIEQIKKRYPSLIRRSMHCLQLGEYKYITTSNYEANRVELYMLKNGYIPTLNYVDIGQIDGTIIKYQIIQGKKAKEIREVSGKEWSKAFEEDKIIYDTIEYKGKYPIKTHWAITI